MTRACVLTIAGSDSGGGAGVQADLKAFVAYGVHGASAITAVTAQNSRQVTDVFALPESSLEAQIDAVFSDLRPDTVKIGMLSTASIVRLVARKLREFEPACIVLDPVMIASTGARLLEEDAVDALRSELLPLATIVTPNWLEAGELINAFPRGLEDIERIVISLQRLGVRSMLIKGGHLEGAEVIDTLHHEGTYTQFTHPRIAGADGHGTGCALSSSVAAGLALGMEMNDACGLAVEFVVRALQERYAVGGSREAFLNLSEQNLMRARSSSISWKPQ
ncbi:MAG: bifunctional hydroxymethylpyrimidine kinase/phosphomethylpyrimidine kinase [Acidobacteriota bacterium]